MNVKVIGLCGKVKGSNIYNIIGGIRWYILFNIVLLNK